MNTTLTEINEILVLLDKIMDDLFMGKIIRTGNEFYEEYKKKIKSFMQKNKIDDKRQVFLCWSHC